MVKSDQETISDLETWWENLEPFFIRFLKHYKVQNEEDLLQDLALHTLKKHMEVPFSDEVHVRKWCSTRIKWLVVNSAKKENMRSFVETKFTWLSIRAKKESQRKFELTQVLMSECDQHLSEDDAKAMKLFLLGHTGGEIAKKLGITEIVAKKRVSRSRFVLSERTKIEDNDDE